MSIGGEKFHETRDEVLAENGVVNRDGVGDSGDGVIRLPTHGGKLVSFVGQGEGLDLHHAQALHGVSEASPKMVVGSGFGRKRCLWVVDAEVFVTVADGDFFNQIDRVKEVKAPSWHGEHQMVGSRAGVGHFG